MGHWTKINTKINFCCCYLHPLNQIQKNTMLQIQFRNLLERIPLEDDWNS